MTAGRSKEARAPVVRAGPGSYVCGGPRYGQPAKNAERK